MDKKLGYIYIYIYMIGYDMAPKKEILPLTRTQMDHEGITLSVKTEKDKYSISLIYEL